MKRIFLATSDIHSYLTKNSLTCKLYKYADKNSYMYEFEKFSCVLEEYKKPLEGLVLLVVIGPQELDEPIKSLQEVSDDKRYSKDYLTLFGKPESYEFDENKVFAKCDSVGLDKMNLHFMQGMTMSKVFRVVLYRLSQFYFEDSSKTKKLKKAYKLAQEVFEQSIIENLIESLDEPQIYALNFKAFIQETDFFATDFSKKPIYFFDKKEKLFELVKE